MPRVPETKAQKVYSGAGFCQELISDRACLLKKVHLVTFNFNQTTMSRIELFVKLTLLTLCKQDSQIIPVSVQVSAYNILLYDLVA